MDNKQNRNNKKAASRNLKKRMHQSVFVTFMRKKLIVVFIIVMALLAFLVYRIYAIEKVDGETYKQKVLSQRNYTSTTLVAKRGDILDRKGTVLANSTDVYNIVLDASVMLSQDGKYVDDTIKALVKCFGVEEGEIRAFLAESPDSKYYVLKKMVSYEDKCAFEELSTREYKKEHPEEYVNGIKGVWFEKEYVRNYPNNTLACDVIGFTLGTGTEGYFGLEEYYNEDLTGTNGREYGYLNTDSDLERTVKPAVNGNNLVSTIDANIQSIVEKYIQKFNDEHRGAYRKDEDGSTNTAVIVMDPNNGEILAMASYPYFDLNNPREIDGIEGLSDEEVVNVLNQRWRNFCLSDTFEPGSTAKPLTVACGIDTGKIKGNETFFCDGAQSVGGHNIRCVNRNGHGEETIGLAISKSCNDVLMQIADKIGIDTFADYQKIFGVGEKTGIDLPGEASGIYFTKEKMGPTDLATYSFGQNFTVTMVQMAAATSSLINGGYYYQPHVVKKITTASGGTVRNINDTLVKQTVSTETSDIVKGYLYETVATGTAKTAKVPGYSMGGKTGTAEKLGRNKEDYVVSFIGYAPADNPEVLIYVVIDEPNVEDQAHSTYAQELAKNIMTEVLPYMNIFPTEEFSMEDLDYISTTSGDAQATTSGDAEGGHAIDDADISALVNQAILYMYENSVVTTTSGEAEEKKENE